VGKKAQNLLIPEEISMAKYAQTAVLPKTKRLSVRGRNTERLHNLARTPKVHIASTCLLLYKDATCREREQKV